MSPRITILPESMLRQLHSRRINGETTAKLAHEIGVSYRTLKDAFRLVGLYLHRKATRATAGSVKPIMRKRQVGKFWTAGRLAEAHAAHMAGESLTCIAMRYGQSLSSLGKALDRAGLERRTRRGPAPGSASAHHRGSVQPHACVTLNGICLLCEQQVA